VKKTFILLFFALFAFLLGFVLFNFIIMPLLVGHGKEVLVPDLRGKSLQQVESILKEKGLEFSVAKEIYDPNIPVGYVISQDPSAQMTVKRGRKIILTVSKGEERVSVPSLCGLFFSQAQILLKRSGLAVGKTETVYSDSIPKDCVISHDPPPGSIVEQGAKVNLLLSLGPLVEKVFMPNLIGKKIEEARILLLNNGLVIGEVQYIKSENLEPGTILLQTPQVGVEMERGDTVRLAVSARESIGE